MNSKHWMAWEGGVNLLAKTSDKLDSPNFILHAARLVHTPFGSGPAGMIFWQPDPAAPPLKFGFVSSDSKISAYLSEEIFAGTPFHGAPRISGNIHVEISPADATARVEIPGYIFETSLTDFSPADLVQRPPLPTSPFHQHGLEAVAAKANVKVNDAEIDIIVSGSGITGGPSAFLAAIGLYIR